MVLLLLSAVAAYSEKGHVAVKSKYLLLLLELFCVLYVMWG